MTKTKGVIVAPADHSILIAAFGRNWDYVSFSASRKGVVYDAGILFPPTGVRLAEAVFRIAKVMSELATTWYVPAERVQRLEEIALKRGAVLRMFPLLSFGQYASIELLAAVEQNVKGVKT